MFVLGLTIIAAGQKDLCWRWWVHSVNEVNVAARKVQTETWTLAAETGATSFGWVIRALKNAVSSQSTSTIYLSRLLTSPLSHLKALWLHLGSCVNFLQIDTFKIVESWSVPFVFSLLRRWHTQGRMPCPMTAKPERYWSDAMPASAAASDLAAFRQR